jgi:hypothetical protein
MTDKPFAERKTYAGELSRSGNALELKLDVSVDVTGAAEVILGAIPLTNESKFLLTEWHKPSNEVVYFIFRGLAEDGTRFETEHLMFNSMGTASDDSGSRITPVGRCERGVLRFKLVEPQERPVLRMRLRGFENFGRLHQSCKLGTISMGGQHDAKDRNAVIGDVAMQPDTMPADPAAWRVEAEALLRHVISVMSLAAASQLRVPIVEFYVGSEREVTVLSQSRQSPSALRIVHFMTQGAIFEAAVRSFFNPPIPVKHLGFAIEWFSMDAGYTEQSLVNAMTTLENLIDANADTAEELITPKKEFEKTRRALRKSIARCLTKWPVDAAKDAAAELNEKLADLNRRSLLRKLALLAKRWNVPLSDISETSLRAAKQARDRIVHRGQYYEDAKASDPDLWAHLLIVREVAARILLTVIGYNGRYITYIGGYRDADFPRSSTGDVLMKPG